MQTFLPYSDFYQTASVLDWRRLGKQRVEAKQILLTIDRGDEAKGWKNHPAVNMWRGYESALAQYGIVICLEWIERGYNDTQLPWFQERVVDNDIELPWWLENDRVLVGHRSNLLRKNHDHYSQFWPDIPDDIPYYWPVESTVVA
jgi:hypothetical protein